MTDATVHVADTQDPGWYPDRVSPNVQRYWDGQGWTAQRRWFAGQWQSEPLGSGPVPRTVSATPHLGGTASGPATRRGPRASGATTVSGSQMGLFLSSILLIVGSFTPWLTVSLGGFGGSASGTDSSISSLIGVNGWVTFSGGILLFVLVCMAVMNAESFFRSASLIIALVVTGFAVYDLVRILQKISQNATPSFNNTPIPQLHVNADVGWGLIVVVIGAVGALLCAWGQARSD